MTTTTTTTTTSIHVQSGDLRQILELCLPCTATELSRFVLHGIELTFLDSTTLVAVATDGRKLVRVTMPYAPHVGDMAGERIIIDPQQLRPLVRLLPRNKQVRVVMAITRSDTASQSGILLTWQSGHGKSKKTRTAQCREIIGRFPKADGVIRTGEQQVADGIVHFNPQAWREAYATWIEQRGAKFTCNGSAALKVDSPTLPITMHVGADVDTSIDFEWLLDHVSLLQCKEASLHWWQDGAPVQIISDRVEFVLAVMASR